jgi:uncharacterized membrane protein
VSGLTDKLQRASDRLLFVPVVFSVLAVIGAGLMVTVDQQLVDGDDLPRIFRTSVDGGREVLATVAMGLLTAYTLLLTLVLVAIQLASNQFSPRTVRNWLGDATLQRALGLVMGTVIFCLVALYQTRSLGEDDAFEPHLSVLTAIILAVLTLVMVLRSADHLADSMRVGAVAKNVTRETVALLDRLRDSQPVDRPGVNPAPRPIERPTLPPDGAHVVESDRAGWVQAVDLESLLDACPADAEVHVPVAVGSFVLTATPLVWLQPGPTDPDGFDERVRDAVTLGDIRTMHQDVGFGITRLVDIALKALSPAMNDANTAKDVIAHLGEVVLAILAQPERDGVHRRDGRQVVSTEYSHREYLHSAFDQVRRNAVDHPEVVATMVRTLLTISQEVERRDLPASTRLVDELIQELADDVGESQLSARDRHRVLELIPADLGGRAAATTA